jgi:hypothetical protein
LFDTGDRSHQTVPNVLNPMAFVELVGHDAPVCKNEASDIPALPALLSIPNPGRSRDPQLAFVAREAPPVFVRSTPLPLFVRAPRGLDVGTLQPDIERRRFV